MATPEGFNTVIQQTNTQYFKYFESVGSTNQIAVEWLEESAPDGAIVFADHQSSGRGRFNRLWVTQPKSAIALSIILHPTWQEQQKISFFSPLAAVALTNVLEKELHINAEIKWPNDVLIQKKKTSGILTESIWKAEQLLGIVVGIGINVFSSSLPPEMELNFPATYLQAHTPLSINRYDLLASYINTFQFWRPKMLSPEFLNYWTNRLAFRGEKVYIKQKDGNIQLSGTLLGITEKGDLEILSEDNQIHSITAGDVHLRPVEQEN